MIRISKQLKVIEMSSRMPGRSACVLRLSGREDGSVLKLFARAVWSLSFMATPKEMRLFVQEAQEHFGSWDGLLNYCREWMVIE